VAATAASGERIDTLTRVWDRPAGIIGWLSQVNHKAIGVRFIVTAFAMFGLAGVGAILMRVQLAQPNLNILSPEAYNQLMTMHGTTMMFLFAVPVVEGFGIYLVPLMIGARDMAFPRLNAFGYWVFLLAAITLYFGLFTGDAPDGGWFNYVPLSTREFSPGLGIDYWTAAITFLEIAALVAAVELIVTIFKMRAPGMSLNRMPIFVWAILVTAFMIVFAMPPLMLASVFLALDRTVGTHFFNIAAGGDALLWQHIFWFFGHPEVYIIFVPALGMVASIVPTFARRPAVGYTLLVLSIVAIGFISFGLWVHHMFATGLPRLGLSFFAGASAMIAIPSGIQMLSLVATLWTGRVVLRTPLLYVLGFFFIFLIGGITGVMVGSVPFDEQVHDTYFVVAHFHYVIIGGMLFPILGAIYYWFPKVTGRRMSERLGTIAFWLLIVGFNITFFTMHITGFLGMPRRVYTYHAGLGWDGVNLISTFGSFVLALGFVLIAVDVARSLRGGPPAGDNPWGAPTLEWATSSPPPPYNFREIPVVHSRDPLWEQAGPPVADPGLEPAATAVALNQRTERREALGTDLLDAAPHSRVFLADASIWPLVTAIAVGIIFAGLLVSLWFVPIGAVLTYVGLIGWLWPSKDDRQPPEEIEA
jgi:cytochrome c oxidase subunit I+III